MESTNDIFIMIISISVVLLLLIVFIVSFLFIYQKRQLRHQLEIETVKEQVSQEILKAQLEIKEQTLTNIAEDIHDNVGQVLSLVVLTLSAVDTDDKESANQKIENTMKLVEKAVADLRNLSKKMDAENIISGGLLPVIKMELDMISKTGFYHTNFQYAGIERRIDTEKELILYRVVQECLNNIIKHAKANRININLRYEPLAFCMEITDNGTGFDQTAVAGKEIGKKGAGLNNMKRRIGLIGGEFEIRTAAGKGTDIIISIPYTAA
ncbi:MAG: sensor histidine kinase [Ferruginibacter sp.]